MVMGVEFMWSILNGELLNEVDWFKSWFRKWQLMDNMKGMWYIESGV